MKMFRRGNKDAGYAFEGLPDVTVTGIDVEALPPEELGVLRQQARYCQAMVDADVRTLDALIADGTTFTHMSGMTQTKREYLADIASGALDYHAIGIENPRIRVEGDYATIDYTAALNANAYGARGTFRMRGLHAFELREGSWLSVNAR